MRRSGTLLAAFAGVALAASSAWAQDYEYEYESEEEIGGMEYEDDLAMDPEFDDASPDLVTPIGMGLSVGGGVAEYLGEADVFTDPGGTWEARYLVGTRTIIGGELAYLGTANSLQTLGVDDNAVLMSNGAEGALRVNFLTDAWQPYVLGGVGWKHFNVVNTDTNTSDIRDSDDALTVPLGAGIAYRYSNVFADLRGMYRPAFLADITRGQGNDDTGLDTIGGSLNVGFEF